MEIDRSRYNRRDIGRSMYIRRDIGSSRYSKGYWQIKVQYGILADQGTIGEILADQDTLGRILADQGQ